jgi:hypothetical protein
MIAPTAPHVGLGGEWSGALDLFSGAEDHEKRKPLAGGGRDTLLFFRVSQQLVASDGGLLFANSEGCSFRLSM